MTNIAVTSKLERDGKLLRLTLNRAKANIIDAEMIEALTNGFTQANDTPELLAVLLDHDGPNFSFGASVEEHLPDQCGAMLGAMHGLIKKMLACPVPVLVAVSGQCLGGGLEVAMAGSLIFVDPDAKLGQPEIKIGVIAPAATCLLPRLVAPVHARDLLFSGRSISGAQAAEIGLAHSVSNDPKATALAYFDAHYAGLSASSLRCAVEAANEVSRWEIAADLDRVEALYLNSLMATHDAVEGLKAFIEKRPAKWIHG